MDPGFRTLLQPISTLSPKARQISQACLDLFLTDPDVTGDFV